MAKIDVSQLSFNGGELAPALYGRYDLARYATGVALAENFVMRPHGGAYKRVGTYCITETLEEDKPTKLIPFRFSVVQSYMLELGDRQMRIIKDDALVAYPPGHDQEYETVVIETPYAADDLERLRYCQTADMIVFSHPNYRLRKLKRYDHHDWRFEDFNFGEFAVDPPTGLRIVKDGRNGVIYCVSALKSASEESLASDTVAATVATGMGIPEPVYDELNIEQCYQLWVTQYGQEWPPQWNIWENNTSWIVYTYLRSIGFGNVVYVTDNGKTYYETRGPDGTKYKMRTTDNWYSVAISYTNRGYGGVLAAMRAAIEEYVTDYNDRATATGITTLEWNEVEDAETYYVYRALSDAEPFYFLGSTEETTYTDEAAPADGSRGPVIANNPFAGPNDNPGVAIFYEQRLVLARSNDKPTTFWGSRTGVFDDFSTHSPLQDDDAYNYTLDTAGEMNEIFWAVPLNEILFGTSGGEFKAGGGGYAITPNNVNARAQSFYGCAPVQPVVIGRAAVFVGRSRQVLRDMSYSLDKDGFDGDDLTLYASHLFENRAIVGLCHQQEPTSVLWVVMSDGGLLSCVYLPNQQVVAWSRHSTQGRFESCASLVDIDGTDRVYFVVTRTINGQQRRFIEVMQSSLIPSADLEDAFYVDCGLSYEGLPTASLAGLDHLEGCEVAILADGCHAAATVTNGRIQLDNQASKIHIGLGYPAAMETLDIQPAQQPIKARPHIIRKVQIDLEKTVSCRVGPIGGPCDEIIKAEGDGRPRLFNGRCTVFPESPKEDDGYRLRFESDQPYPLCILAINAIGDIGAE